MKCKQCNADVVDGALFCGSCGARVDGKKECKQCGNMNDENQKFCSYCGARIDGKTVCKKCGTEYEGKFCFNCGDSKDEVKQTLSLGKANLGKNTAKGVAVKTATKSNKVMRIAAGAIALFGAMTAFIFMFFVGLGGDEATKKGIFYFLIDNMKNLKGVNGDDYYSPSTGVKMVDSLLCILPFIVSIVMIVLVMLFLAFSIIKFIRSIANEDEKAIRFSVLTMITYILGVSLIYMVFMYKNKQAPEDNTVFNGATTVGVVLCTISLIGASICKLLEYPLTFKKGKVVALIGVAVATIAMALAIQTGVSGRIDDENASESFLFAGSNFGKWYGDKWPNYYYYSHGRSDKVFIMETIFAQGLLMTAVICFALSLFRNIKNVTEKKEKSGLLWALLSTAFSVIVLILTVLIQAHIKKLIAYEDYYSSQFKLVMPILLVVFAFINLGVAITSKIVYKKNRTK